MRPGVKCRSSSITEKTGFNWTYFQVVRIQVPSTPGFTLHIAVAVVLLCRMPLEGATVRVSFLTDKASLSDTSEFLRKSGCGQSAASAFERAVKTYSLTGFDFDLSKFPKPREGFYSFESASNLVAALPHQLCNTAHA